MVGTKAGGLKARDTNMKKWGKDYYKRIGAEGGRSGHTGGFHSNPALARIAGAKGGKNSKRGPAMLYSATGVTKHGIETYLGWQTASSLAKALGCTKSAIYSACCHDTTVNGLKISSMTKKTHEPVKSNISDRPIFFESPSSNSEQNKSL